MDFSTGKFETADSLSSAWRPSSELIEKVVEADEADEGFEDTDGVQAFIDEAFKAYQPPMVQRQDVGRLEGPGASVVKRSDGSVELDDLADVGYEAGGEEDDEAQEEALVAAVASDDGFAIGGSVQLIEETTPPRRSTRKRLADEASEGTCEKGREPPPPPSKKARDAKKAVYPSVDTFPFFSLDRLGA
jgi:hypothetical protein